jgi:hypothetical protein
MFAFREQTVPQSYSIDREEEDVILEKVIQEQQEDAISCAINDNVSDPYDRMVIKLIALDGWHPEHVAKCAGVSKNDVLQTLRKRVPRFLDAYLQARASSAFA